MTKQEIQTRIEELESSIKDLKQAAHAPEGKGRWQPLDDEEYFYVDDTNTSSHYWKRDDIDLGLMALGNVFKTEPDAELHRLRLESMANRWRPEVVQRYWYWSKSKSQFSTFQPDFWAYDLANFAIGNCHETEEAAKAWGEKYGQAFMALLEDK